MAASRRGGLVAIPDTLTASSRQPLVIPFIHGFVWFRQISCVVERNWQNVSELGVFRVVETVTLEMVNRLWNRDLCATPIV